MQKVVTIIFFLCDYCMHLRFKSFSATWLVCLSFPIISLQMWTAHGQMRSPSWHMCQCIINILPKWRQKKQEEDVLQRCKTFKDFMILIKSIPYHSYSISWAWVLLLKQQWSFKPLTRARVRGEQISHWRLGMEWEQVLLLVNQLSVVLFNPLTPTSDQDRISPYNIDTISSR